MRANRLLLLATLTVGVLGAGCNRQFYRRGADNEVACVLSGKDRFEEWKIQNMHVYPDPRARFADPTNPDCPPPPPDDPASHFMSPNPQRVPPNSGPQYQGTGYIELLSHWDAFNRQQAGLRLVGEESQQVRAENAGPPRLGDPSAQPAYLPPTLGAPGSVETPERPYLITIDQAVELGLINSREFQDRREDLYVAALPVTRERFAFSTQAFALEQLIRERTGANVGPFGKGDRWISNSNMGLQKIFSTGALLLVQFANQTVIELTNPANRHTTSVSSINLDFVQPLLRGGGRAVALESLTQAERSLLYEIRSYARFRKEFFQHLTGGNQGFNQAPGGAGVGGAVAVGVGAGAPVSLVTPSAAGRLNLAGASGAPSTGFMPILVNMAQLRNQEKNVADLKGIENLFVNYEQGGEVSALQVGQVKLQLLQAQQSVLQNEQQVRQSFDQFKLQLGLPLTTPLEFDDSLVTPINRQLEKFDAAVKDYNSLVAELDKNGAKSKPGEVRGAILRVLTESPLAKGTKNFRVESVRRWERWRKEFADLRQLSQELDKLRAQRRKLLDLKSDLEEKGQLLSEKDAAELRSAEQRLAMGSLEASVRRFEAAPWEKEKNPDAGLDMREDLWREVRNSLVLVMGEASAERLDSLRRSWPVLPPVLVEGIDLASADLEQAYDAAVQRAMANRLDLMNARGDLMDAWRQVAVFANGLMGVFNVAYQGDLGTPPGLAKPLAFQSRNNRHRLVMNWELPLVRLNERNAYRAALIAYQQARRRLMRIEDEIAADVRSEIRQLQVLAKTFRIQQQAVELQYLQVESSLETFLSPPQPGAGGGGAGNVAALTQQLLGAYRGLPQVQNQLYNIWINYLVQRQLIYLDTEMMTLDGRGVWIDEYDNVANRRTDASDPRPATNVR